MRFVGSIQILMHDHTLQGDLVPLLMQSAADNVETIYGNWMEATLRHGPPFLYSMCSADALPRGLVVSSIFRTFDLPCDLGRLLG